eukprot:CAMPEP_0174856128 /NCGR_PEP_ID=MMETSP1114-20130205/35139_1 /TAXON_ID=312471 /ORGANISM="Neobodo designis, Strain CCAP 1951/1" /LENGTH=521 /DNA_ID=CAMNT_0016090907 /DNA_START=139 /DNA_END=1704 /DNA_ORIENTATION=-
MERFANPECLNFATTDTREGLAAYFRFVLATHTTDGSHLPISIVVVYAGAFAVSKGTCRLVLRSSPKEEKVDVFDMLHGIVGEAATPRAVHLSVLVDSACPVLIGTSSKSRCVRPDAVEKTLADVSDRVQGMVMWPVATVSGDISFRRRPDSDSDSDSSDSDSDSGSSDDADERYDDDAGTVVSTAITATLEAVAGTTPLRESVAKLRRVASEKMKQHADMGVVASADWCGHWLQRPPRARDNVAMPLTAVAHAGAPVAVHAQSNRDTQDACVQAGTLNVNAPAFTPPSSVQSVSGSTASQLPAHSAPRTEAAPQEAGAGFGTKPVCAGGDDGRRGIFYCEVCQCDVFGDHNWALHLASEKHKRREILTNPEMAGKLDATQTAMLVNPKNFYKCDVCNVVISGQANILQHVNGAQHKKNAARKGIVLPDPEVEAGYAPAPTMAVPPPPSVPTYASTPSANSQAPSSSDPVYYAAECKACNQRFANDSDLLDHCARVHGSDSYSRAFATTEPSAHTLAPVGY